MVLCGLAAATFAQLPIKFGITAGLNVSNVSMSSGSISLSPDWKAGLQVGVIADISLGALSVMPELVFSQKGYKMDYASNYYTYGEENSGETGTASTTVNYLTLPINLAYKIDLGLAGTLFPFAGPYAGYALSGTWKESISDLSDKIKIGSGDDADLKALDFGLNFGVGYQFSKIMFRLKYDLGLTNLQPGAAGDYSLKSKNLTVGAGFFF